MRQATCCECGLTTTVRSFYSLNGKTYCEPCVWKAAKEAKEAGNPAEYAALQDHSICGRCGTYSGDSTDHQLIGKVPLCSTCASQVAAWPYPTWLKLSLAAMLALLVVALLHGRKYFHAGRTMYVGERLVAKGEYEKALPYLQETLQIAPGSDKAVLLTAKAGLLSGNPEVARKAIQGHSDGHFEDPGKDFEEVQAIWGRAMRAFKEASEAAKLADQDGHAEEAAKMMHEAAALYPESKELAAAAEIYDAGAAYERKDYDGFLAIAQKQWQQYPTSYTAAAVSSALACKYAVSGNPEFKRQAEEMLETARMKAQGDADQEKGFAEYAERTHYRLETRQIISKQEYDRRFRANKQAVADKKE